MSAHRPACWLAIALALSACTVRPISEEQAMQWSDLPLVSFLDKRYPSPAYPLYPVPRPAVSYTAFFKGGSYNLLFNPVTDLGRYCAAQKCELQYTGKPPGASVPGAPGPDAGSALAAAIDGRAFGQFVCSSSSRGEPLWRVSIWPAAILSPNAETMGSYRAVIAIRPL